MQKIIYIILVFSLIINFSSCKNQNAKTDITKKAHQSQLPQYSARYSPLTYGKFLAIRNNQDPLSKVDIDFKIILDPDQYGIFQNREELILQTYETDSLTLNYFEIYLGDYNHEVDNANPPIELFLERQFTPSALDVLYNYLDANHEYFFNEQFDAFDTGYVHMCEAQYMFTIAFYEPTSGYETSYNALAFSKCSDNNPDSIYQGLINLIQTNYLSQFEE